MLDVTFMQFPEKVLPEMEHQILKQFLNELVPNYYSKVFFSEWFDQLFKKLKIRFSIEKSNFPMGMVMGFLWKN